MAQIKCTTCNGTGWIETPDPPPSGGYTISKTVGPGSLVIHASDRFAGAIDSLIWMGKEFINCLDHGRELQSASSFDDLGEDWNPTEAGSNMDNDGTGPTSTSKLLEVGAVGNVLKTKSQMAFWKPVNGVKLSNHILTKKVTIGHDASDHVIECLVNFKVTENHSKAKFEPLTGYMPPEFNTFYTFNPATRQLARIGHKEQSLPVVLATEDGKYAMGCYCPDKQNIAGQSGGGYGAFDSAHLQQNVVKWNIVFRQGTTPAGNYPFRCYAIVGSLENVRVSLIQLWRALQGTPGPVPQPIPPDPQPPDPPISGEIKDFKRMPECDNPISIYFSSCKVDGEMNFGEYGLQGGYTSKIIRYPHTTVQEFLAESVFDICEFKGSWYCSLEHGGYPDIDRGMVMRWNGSKWVESFRHPSWILAFHLHVHTDGYLYVTGSGWNPMIGGIWRTADGTHWEKYAGDNGVYVYWDMTSEENNLWSVGAHGGDYGPGCHPAVYRNKNLVRESSEQDAGYLGVAYFLKDIFMSQANPGKVIRFSDKKTVFNVPVPGKIPKLIVDEMSNMLIAICCTDDSATGGATVWGTKDGNKWHLIRPPFSCPHLFHAYQDPDSKEIWLVGGKFACMSQDGYGRIYKSVRG